MVNGYFDCDRIQKITRNAKEDNWLNGKVIDYEINTWLLRQASTNYQGNSKDESNWVD